MAQHHIFEIVDHAAIAHRLAQRGDGLRFTGLRCRVSGRFGDLGIQFIQALDRRRVVDPDQSVDFSRRSALRDHPPGGRQGVGIRLKHCLNIVEREPFNLARPQRPIAGYGGSGGAEFGVDDPDPFLVVAQDVIFELMDHAAIADFLAERANTNLR
ncbi:MAG: hypothetical protein O3B74_09225 [Proteobacteria bacterium]|nr:hypothetical protein [Pseudomonadota bacterium]